MGRSRRRIMPDTITATASSVLDSSTVERYSSTRPTEVLDPLIVCGPSGVGKGTLIEMLMKRFPNDQFGFSVSHTTRKPRPGEVDGQHYHFVNEAAFLKLIEQGAPIMLDKGTISLQSESHPVQFRKVELLNLAPENNSN